MTAAASFTAFAASVLLISLVGRLLGITLLGEYLLLRRVAAWLQPLTQLGQGVALPRYAAYSSQQSRSAQLEYFAASAVCVFPFVLTFGVVLGVARRMVGKTLFGSADHSHFVLPVFLLILGGAAQMLVYGFYRGQLRMRRAGALQLCVGAIPIVAAATLYRTQSVLVIASASGLGVFAVAFGFGVPVLKEVQRHRAIVGSIRSRARELLRYGTLRVPGDFSFGALLAIGPVVATHYMPVSRVSCLLLALSMLTAASITTEPLGLVFLSKISMMIADNRIADVEKYLSHLMSAVLDCSVFVTIQLVIFADVLVKFWIGPKMLDSITVVRVLLLGVPFYLFYMALRCAVDAGTVKPLNARNVIVSLMTLLLGIAVSIVLFPRVVLLHAIAGSLVLSFVLLASLTAVSLSALYGSRVCWRRSLLPVSCAVILGAAGLMCHSRAQRSLLALGVLECVFAIAFLTVCYRSGTRWCQLIWEMTYKPTETAHSTLSA